MSRAVEVRVGAHDAEDEARPHHHEHGEAPRDAQVTEHCARSGSDEALVGGAPCDLLLADHDGPRALVVDPGQLADLPGVVRAGEDGREHVLEHPAAGARGWWARARPLAWRITMSRASSGWSRQ